MSYPHIKIKPRNFWTSWSGICFFILLAIALYILFSEHVAHTFVILPFALLLLCPLLHLFMHKSHGHAVDEVEKGIDHEHLLKQSRPEEHRHA